MSAWIDAITSPLKAASETIQGLVQVRDQIKFGDGVIKLQAQILAAQQGASSAQAREIEVSDEIRKLKARVTELKEWKAQKERYQMDRLPPGVIVYTLKEECAAPGEPIHSICPTCYGNGKNFPLHQSEMRHGQYTLTCHSCKTILPIGISTAPMPTRAIISRPRSSF
jgi:hypothetical protein